MKKVIEDNNMRIKLCYAISALSNQGPANVLYNILSYIDYNRFEVSVITMAPEKTISRMADFEKFPIQIYQLAPIKHKNGLVLGIAFNKKLKEIRPNIVHVHCPRSVLLASFIPNDCKRVVTIHNFPELSQIIYGRIKGRIIKYLRMMMTKRIENRVACSESIADRYNKMGVETSAIPNGCSLPLWTYNQREKGEIKKKLGLDLNRQWFLFIGAFVEGKNPRIVVKAFEAFQDTKYGVVLLGDGYLYPELKRHENERILLPGFRDNVYDYVKACDFYISASESEGLPNALLECMSAGLPSALSDIPAHQEIMRKSITPLGRTFDYSNITSVITAIEEVTKLDTRETRTFVQELYASFYTAKTMSEHYQKYYEQILKNK